MDEANKQIDKFREDDKQAMVGAEDDDMEDMDGKAKALTNLLKTSSVSSALTGHDDALR